jgi:hypothetical protein
MEEEQQQRQQQQQQQQPLHDAVVNGIARITDPHCIEDERHTLYVACDDDPHDLGLEPPIDRPSLQHIVDFLDNHRRDSSHREVVITELVLRCGAVTLAANQMPSSFWQLSTPTQPLRI